MGMGVNAAPQPLYPQNPLYRRLGGPQGLSVCLGARSLAPPIGILRKDQRVFTPSTLSRLIIPLTKPESTLGSRGIAPPILNFGTARRRVVNFTSRPLYPPGKKVRYPLNRRLDGWQSSSGRFGEEKNLLLLQGLEICTVQLVAQSLYRLSYTGRVGVYRKRNFEYWIIILFGIQARNMSLKYFTGVCLQKKIRQDQSWQGHTSVRLPFNNLPWLLEEPLTKEGHMTVVNISNCAQKHPYASRLLFSQYEVN